MAPIAQWIERRPPKHEIEVRFLLGAQRLNGSPDLLGEPFACFSDLNTGFLLYIEDVSVVGGGMIILLDQDGVLADFEQGFVNNWRSKNPHEVCVSIEDRKNFYIRDDYPEYLRGKIMNIQGSPGFYENLPPIAGAIEAYKTLLDLGHEVFICTAPLSKYENCVLEKYKWVEKHLGREATKLIVLTGDKTLVMGDILIDDRPEVEGVVTPAWRHILYSAPYNAHVKNKKRLSWDMDWRKVLEI